MDIQEGFDVNFVKDISIIEKILDFIVALIKSNDNYNRLIISVTPKLLDSSLKIVDIEPSRNLSYMLQESLSLIFAGGTLEPVRFCTIYY